MLCYTLLSLDVTLLDSALLRYTGLSSAPLGLDVTSLNSAILSCAELHSAMFGYYFAMLSWTELYWGTLY